MSYSQEEIIDKYRQLRTEIGHSPTSKEFYSETGISEHAAEVAFGNRPYSKIQLAEGDKPRKFGLPGRSPDEFFEVYGNVIRDLQAVPTTTEWKHRKTKPTAHSYRKKLKVNWQQMPFVFQEWAVNKSGWEEVIRICKAHCMNIRQDSDKTNKTLSSVGYVYLMKSGKYYKLGKTNSVGRREYELGAKLPEEVKTIHFIETDDPDGIEAYWHKRFEQKRKKGEWFELSAQDVKVFKKRKRM